MKLNEKRKKIFATTYILKEKHKIVEWEIISNLQDVDEERMYVDCTNLFGYAVKHYEFTRDIAYAFMAVAKKAAKIPRLKDAIKGIEINVSAAKRLLPHLTEDNVDELIMFSKTHSHRETERMLAELGGPTKPIEKVKHIAGGKVRLTVEITEEEFDALERAKAIEAQKGRILSDGEAVGKSLKHFVERKDPVKRAERAEARRAKKQKVGAPLLSKDDFSDIEGTYGRENMTAAQINAAIARDKGGCTHIGSDGKRCCQDRWVDVHHIISVADGGSNHPSNLTTLCSFHHDMVHQLNLPIDGAFNLLRSPQRPYSIVEEPDWESAQLNRLGLLSSQWKEKTG
jgi:hypothetical protein